MKAVVYDRHNHPNKLVFQNVDKPVPNDDEVLIKIHSASVNALDYRSIQMGIGIPKSRIFGADIAGHVEAIGKNIHSFHPGDNVFGGILGCGLGGFSEYVAVPQNSLIMIPDNVSFDEAATLPVAGITALQALRNRGNIQKGQKVLINGSGGGVGTFAIQLAKFFGAEVTAVCSTHNVELARSLGSDHVIDYTKENFTRSNNRYDLILAINGYHPLSHYKRSLSTAGICVMVGGKISQLVISILFGPLMFLGKKKFRTLMAKSSSSDLRFLIDLVKSGEIKPIIDRRYPLEETSEAVRYLSEGHAKGKVLITVLKI
ncbi:MAG: NAD(P)-dependent alcohol dehydrogenase [Bacillota bacterium]